MRRSIALALLMISNWTLIAPVFGPDSDANLPACCRRNGRHHCMMRRMERFNLSQPGLTSVTEKCPCLPASACAAHSPTYKPEGDQRFYAEIVRHAACAAQTEARFRLSFPRGKQKRGPPTPLA